MKRIRIEIYLSFITLIIPQIAFAQGDFNAALNTATTSLKTIAGNLATFITIVLAIAAFAGVIVIFSKISKGDSDGASKAQNWVFGLIFAFLAMVVVKQLWL